MTAIILIILKLWLTSSALVMIWCYWRLADIRSIAIPATVVLILSDAIRGLV